MKHSLRNILLFVFAAITFSSCLFRPSPYKKWYSRRHPKFFYHKGNNYGGRRLWVKQPHQERVRW